MQQTVSFIVERWKCLAYLMLINMSVKSVWQCIFTYYCLSQMSRMMCVSNLPKMKDFSTWALFLVLFQTKFVLFDKGSSRCPNLTHVLLLLSILINIHISCVHFHPMVIKIIWFECRGVMRIRTERDNEENKQERGGWEYSLFPPLLLCFSPNFLFS